MNALLLTLMLQSSLLLPPRPALENPASVTQIPKKLQKDYEKLWTRFVAVTDDSKLVKDLYKLQQKQKAFDPAWVIDGYLSLYKGNDVLAREKFTQALNANPNNRIAIYYLAELAYLHSDYSGAASLYARLQAIDPSRPELETKRQKAFLLATDTYLRRAMEAETDNRLAEAEEYYRQALTLAPNEPSFHARFADLLLKANKIEEANAERKTVEALSPRRAGKARMDEAKIDSLEDIGRWGSEIAAFHQIRDTAILSREQFAVLLVRYFPQVTEFRKSSHILTDVDDSAARSEIQTVVDVGLVDPLPNHAFVPAGPLTRSDLAQALARLTRLTGVSANPNPSVTVPDLTPSNGIYPDLQLILNLGVMAVDDSGRFNLGAEVSGRDGVRAAEGLLRTFQQAQR